MAANTGTSYADILSRPPFYTISGVNSSAPIPQQMEQIDQLNTLLLQEIDANFARLHQIVTARILPEIKRFAIANQPTRESASFWTQFFVSAYGVPPSDADDGHSTFAHSPQRTEYEDHTLALRHDTFDTTRSDGTFLFDPEPGKTSTPLPPRGKRTAHDSSLEASMESPFDKVDRQLSGLSMDVSDAPTPSLPSGYSGLGFGRASPSEELPQFDDTLRYEPRQDAATPRPAGRGASRPAFPSSPSIDSSYNHRLIDLTATPLNMKFRPMAPTSIAPSMRGPPLNQSKKPSATAKSTERNLFDDDEDIKLGMSPPVTMKFSLPPTARSIVKAGTTPMKPAAGARSGSGDGGQEAKALDDLLGDMLDYQPSPRMPTPEGLRRYSVLPGDLSAARRLFDDMPPPSHNSPQETARKPGPPPMVSAEPSQPTTDQSGQYGHAEYDDDETTRQYGGRHLRRSLANTSAGSDIQIQRDVTGRIITDDDSFDDDGDDTLSSEGDLTAQPEAGFELVDDSYMSETSGYPLHRDVTDTGAVGRNEPGETSLFGPPATGHASKQPFALHQQDEMVTYHGGRLEDAAGPESPTRQR